MMIRSRKRTAVLVFGLLLVLTAVPVALTWKAWRQEQLNHGLLLAICTNDIHAAERCLSDGADAKADLAPVQRSPWQLFVNTLPRRPSSEATDSTPLMYVFAVASSPEKYRDATGKFQMPPEPTEMVQLLLKHGADPTGKYSDGSALLLMPVAHEWTNCVRLMLAAGADPNATDKYGMPVMRAALLLRNAETVQALIMGHAYVNWKDTAGRNPMRYATELHDDKMSLLLKRSGARQ